MQNIQVVVHDDNPGLYSPENNNDPANQYVPFNAMRKALAEKLRQKDPFLSRDAARAQAHRQLTPIFTKLCSLQQGGDA